MTISRRTAKLIAALSVVGFGLVGVLAHALSGPPEPVADPEEDDDGTPDPEDFA